jgi:hypothetical protein
MVVMPARGADRRSVVRPLLARPGARFSCSANGACCSDMHLLGPLDARDLLMLRARGVGESIEERERGKVELRCDAEGRCTLSEGRLCSLHVRDDRLAKPSVCRRFPFALIATPLGGRIATAHRCPCRTMGERPLVSLDDASAALTDGADGLLCEREAPARVILSRRSSASFKGWASMEASLLARLSAGEPPPLLLGASPELPPLRRESWGEVAGRFRAGEATVTRGAQAFAWFGDGIDLALGMRISPRARPWSTDFDLAEARAPDPESAADVIGDWIADLLWDLSWIDHGPFDLARASLSALFVIASAITRQLIALGLREDRAAAEAVMISELACAHALWADVLTQLPPASSPWPARQASGTDDQRRPASRRG